MSKLSERVRPDVEAAPWVVEEIKKLEAERDALAVLAQEMREALEDIQKCEFAARVEGLAEVLASIDDEHSQAGRLKDLVERRLLYMTRYADEALATPDTIAAILARRDAAVWVEAAEVCESNDMSWADAEWNAAVKDCGLKLRAKADELENEHG